MHRTFAKFYAHLYLNVDSEQLDRLVGHATAINYFLLEFSKKAVHGLQAVSRASTRPPLVSRLIRSQSDHDTTRS